MTKAMKYHYRVVQANIGWTSEIIRRVTSKKMVVSKSQGGFATEADAQEWGENELKQFLQNQYERNKRQSR